jgi:glycosyltransferase involved in cell wall biosynthesis
MRRYNVAIIQQYLVHYRVPFVNKLAAICKSQGVDLVYYYGRDSSRHLLEEIPECGVPIKVRLFKSLTWQPVWEQTKTADLVIVEQAVKHLITYPLLVRRLLSSQKLAFWGHGRNFQARNPNSPAELLKRSISRHVDWWFAYNELSATVVSDLGFPKDRITSIQNTIDTKVLQTVRSGLEPNSLEQLKSSLSIHSDNVAIFTGGIYSDKRILFLLEACFLIRASVPDFHLIVIGRGPDEDIVRQAAHEHSWIHFVGAKNDFDKIPYWALSKVSLMPGLVGLGILDSFALGVPIVTTNYPFHSPEIDYLRNGVNGIMVENWQDAGAYAQAVTELLLDESQRQRLIDAGKRDADFYTVDNMAANFAGGIMSALSL